VANFNSLLSYFGDTKDLPDYPVRSAFGHEALILRD
jgi:hypothetical protein